MRTSKKSKILALEASSPEELSVNLKEALRQKSVKSRLVTLAVNDPKVMYRPFRFDGIAAKDLRHHLLSDMVEIMSLTPDEIVMDYHITQSDENTIQGICICIPKSLFEKYNNVLDKKGLNPVRITEKFLVNVDWLLQQGKLSGKRACFLDFSAPGTVSLFISNEEKYELLRKIRFEDYGEAEREIIQSLRSASAQSRAKHYDYIYFHGEIKEQDRLSEALKQIFRAQTETIDAIDGKAALTGGKSFFRLNLLRRYNFTHKELMVINAGVNIVIAFCLMNAALIGLQMVKKTMEINRVREYFKASDYQYAVELRDNLKK